jgi:hypothetical protein
MEPISLCIGIGSFAAGYLFSTYMKYETAPATSITISLPSNLISDLHNFDKKKLNTVIANTQPVVDEFKDMLRNRRELLGE